MTQRTTRAFMTLRRQHDNQDCVLIKQGHRDRSSRNYELAKPLLATLLATYLGGVSPAAKAQAIPPIIDPATLDGTNGSGVNGVDLNDGAGSSVSNAGDGSAGFVLNGIDEYDKSGFSVSSAGDINGDGVNDLIIGARLGLLAASSPVEDTQSSIGQGNYEGESYVVFGSGQGFPAEFELSSLLPENGGDGSVGFVLHGNDSFDSSSESVSTAGDVNGDGLDDLIIGAHGADPGGRSYAGESYVVFGSNKAFPAEIEFSSLAQGDGSAGFVLNGIDRSDRSGYPVSAAGDMNGDGLDDLIIGANGADPGGRDSAGETYVVFGTTDGFPAEFELSSLAQGDGSAGFILNGIDEQDRSGSWVSAAGDVNGDGLDDLIIGAYGADPGGRENAGEVYVVFGTTDGFPAEFELSSLLPAQGGDGSNGFILNGIDASELTGVGSPVSAAGDMNGDGIGDLIIGAYHASPGGRYSAGESYVVFGRDTAQSGNFPAEIELSSLQQADGGDGSVGFVLKGIAEYDSSGRSASVAGDINGDGLDDLVIGAWGADPDGREYAGEAYVVYGNAQGFPAEIELSSLMEVSGGDGSVGFVLKGIAVGNNTGTSVATAGDINADGIADLIIGAIGADPGGVSNAGQSYVVFGTDKGFPAEFELSSLLEPTLSATVSSIGDGVAGCRNRTDPQTVLTQLPFDPDDEVSWDCQDLGLTYTAGDAVVLWVRGTVVDKPEFAGSVRLLDEGGTALCRNLTESVSVSMPVEPDGTWDCATAGLPVIEGDVVSAFIRGVVE